MIQITKESIAHLAGLQSRSSGDWADLPSGTPDNIVHTVTEVVKGVRYAINLYLARLF